MSLRISKTLFVLKYAIYILFEPQKDAIWTQEVSPDLDLATIKMLSAVDLGLNFESMLILRNGAPLLGNWIQVCSCLSRRTGVYKDNLSRQMVYTDILKFSLFFCIRRSHKQ